MTDKKSIFLVDDHAVVRTGLKSLIERLGDFEVVAEYSNGKELLDAIPFDNAPDLIIMDLAMPVMDGKDTVAELKKRNVGIPVLILTLETNEPLIISLFRQGIRGYLPKSATADVLKKAINEVLASGYYHDEMLAKALTVEQKDTISEKEQVLKQITEREKEFLRLVCNDQEPTYEQIAEEMEVSRRTVDGYRESLFSKFNIKSKAGLVLFAIKYGIVKVD
ncbi:MAG: response regulator transcription factor [Chitinophagales bacterium]|nr:response regulator transcription factor [Chitinophagaceae bacterium]MCB9063571.1 response regulator transcription factor [Chitinophagales bacterium]